MVSGPGPARKEGRNVTEHLCVGCSHSAEHRSEVAGMRKCSDKGAITLPATPLVLLCPLSHQKARASPCERQVPCVYVDSTEEFTSIAL